MSLDARMTLARAREKLGGRVVSHGRGGEIVRVGEHVGVVLWSDEAQCDVWIGDDKTKRVPCHSITVAASPELRPIAEDARAFAQLEEGQEVVFDESTSGRLV